MAVNSSTEWTDGGQVKTLEIWDSGDPDISVTISSSLRDKSENCTHPPERVMLTRGRTLIEEFMSRK